MGLLQKLSSSMLGLKGVKPLFNGESKESTLHYLSSVNNQPNINRNPSILDETDNFNTNKYRSASDKTYLNNKPN